MPTPRKSARNYTTHVTKPTKHYDMRHARSLAHNARLVQATVGMLVAYVWRMTTRRCPECGAPISCDTTRRYFACGYALALGEDQPLQVEGADCRHSPTGQARRHRRAVERVRRLALELCNQGDLDEATAIAVVEAVR